MLGPIPAWALPFVLKVCNFELTEMPGKGSVERENGSACRKPERSQG